MSSDDLEGRYRGLLNEALRKHLRQALLLKTRTPTPISHTTLDRVLLSALSNLRKCFHTKTDPLVNPPLNQEVGKSEDEHLRDFIHPQSLLSKIQTNWARPRRAFTPPLATSVPDRPEDVNELAKKIEQNWLTFFPKALVKLTFPDEPASVTDKNTVQVLTDAAQCCESMWKSIDAAKDRIWLETFCFDESAPSRILLAKLKKAAQRGVEVVISVDAVGSLGVGGTLARAFRDCPKTAKVHQFNPPWRPVGPLVYRDHRKVLICDNIAYTGSLNFDWRAVRLPKRCEAELQQAEEILGKSPLLSFSRVLQWIFRDTSATRPPDLNLHVALKGPCVENLAHSFHQVCRRGSVGNVAFPVADRPHNQSYLLQESKNPHRPGNDLDLPDIEGVPKFKQCLVQVLKSDGRQSKERNSYLKMLKTTIKHAEHSLVIASSYFHPPRSLRKPLAKTVRRGVPSALILSGLSDVMFDSQATLAVLPYFLIGRANLCRSFFVRRQHLHMKTVTVDSVWTSIGSFNFDRYSARRNLELGVSICDPRVARYVNDKLEEQLVEYKADGPKLRPGTEEFTLDQATKLSLLTRLGGLMSYHLVRATGASWLDGFVVKSKEQHRKNL